MTKFVRLYGEVVGSTISYFFFKFDLKSRGRRLVLPFWDKATLIT